LRLSCFEELPFQEEARDEKFPQLLINYPISIPVWDEISLSPSPSSPTSENFFTCLPPRRDRRGPHPRYIQPNVYYKRRTRGLGRRAQLSPCDHRRSWRTRAASPRRQACAPFWWRVPLCAGHTKPSCTGRRACTCCADVVQPGI
jgi:hypothetical protein